MSDTPINNNKNGNLIQTSNRNYRNSTSNLKTVWNEIDNCDCKHEEFHRIISLDGNSFQELDPCYKSNDDENLLD